MIVDGEYGKKQLIYLRSCLQGGEWGAEHRGQRSFLQAFNTRGVYDNGL